MRTILTISLIILLSPLSYFAQEKTTIYKDSTKSIRERVDDLLSRMTVLEKARQLDMYSGGAIVSDNHLEKEKADKVIGIDGIGSLHDFYPTESELSNQVQKYMVEKTRLGIPAY